MVIFALEDFFMYFGFSELQPVQYKSNLQQPKAKCHNFRGYQNFVWLFSFFFLFGLFFHFLLIVLFKLLNSDLWRQCSESLNYSGKLPYFTSLKTLHFKK